MNKEYRIKASIAFMRYSLIINSSLPAAYASDPSRCARFTLISSRSFAACS